MADTLIQPEVEANAGYVCFLSIIARFASAFERLKAMSLVLLMFSAERGVQSSLRRGVAGRGCSGSAQRVAESHELTSNCV